MERPSREVVNMQVAEAIAQRGTCSRASVGVVIAREGRILVTGYNGAPAGMPHCDHSSTMIDGCKTAVHAEANAIAYAARYGISLEGAEMFTTMSPCLPCAQITINAGIRKVHIRTEYRDRSGVILLENAGIDIITPTC